MEWNLRLVAAKRGVWTATELRRMLAEYGLTVSAGKMSKWWSGCPVSVKLTDLDVLCAVLGCAVDELLTPRPAARSKRTATLPADRIVQDRPAGSGTSSQVTEQRRK